MEQTAATWLAHYGAPALFALLTLGVFGLPIPDESILVLAGLLVSRGQLGAGPAIAAAAGGAMFGISVSFAIGRFAGIPLFARFCSVLRLDASLVRRVERWFERIGKWLLTVGYFVPGVRHVTAIVAGASGLPGGTFVLFAYSGAVLWVACFLSVGYLVGEERQRIVLAWHRYLSVGLVASVVLATGVVIWIRRRPRDARR